MRLHDCVLDVDCFIGAPLARNQPEEGWVSARDAGAIPQELFELYVAAGFLSFGGGSRFLTDERNVLFSYFSLLLNSLMDGLVDAKDQLADFEKNQNLTYDHGKKLRGESWDPSADRRARRHLRDLLIALDSSLDTVAEIIAIFLTGRFPELRVGRSDFRAIERWVARPLSASRSVSTPYDSHLQKLYEALKPLILPGPPEVDWLPLMHMLRNKSIHLGQATLRQVGLYDASVKAYIFIPRKWPFIWERDFKRHDISAKSERVHMPTFLADLLIHQDILSFAHGLHKKVIAVVRTAISEVLSMYRAFENFDTNAAAIVELNENSVTFKFDGFVET
jgi:hypothetical protein